jgi:putative MFS transporter
MSENEACYVEKNYDKLQIEPTYQDTTLEDDKKQLLKKNRKSSLFCIPEEKPEKDENVIDLYLDKIGYTSYHYNLIFILSLMYFSMSGEFFIINILLSTLQKEWNLSNSKISLLGSATFFGIFITSLLAGWINNKYGRKLPSILGCICISIFSILSCFSQSIWHMFWAKVMIGIGIGIMIPGTTSLLTESIPKQNRSFTLNAVWGLYPIGMIYICYVAINYIHKNVLLWRSVCLINSLSSVIVVFLSFYLKESPRYLILKGQFSQGFRILNLMGKPKDIFLSYEQENKIQVQTGISQKKNENSFLGAYFEDDFKIITPFLIFLWYSSSLISYGLLYVMPKHFENLTKKDKADSLKSMMSSLYILALCPFLRGMISELEFLGRKKTLALGFLGAFFLSICCTYNENKLSFFSGTLNFFINISLGLVSVYTSEVYPTHLRSGALGIGNAFTRLGGITAPFICEYMDKHIDKGSFKFFAVIGLLSMFLSCGLSRETRGRELDHNYKSNINKIQEEIKV